MRKHSYDCNASSFTFCINNIGVYINILSDACINKNIGRCFFSEVWLWRNLSRQILSLWTTGCPDQNVLSNIFYTSTGFSEMRYHSIANEMAWQIHYVIVHNESRLLISSAYSKWPRLSCLTPSYLRQTDALRHLQWSFSDICEKG